MKDIDYINISSLDLNLLRTFVVLMEERSVSLASERLSLSQSATSNALERIRVSFGDRVLEREGQEMVPTRTALALWPKISDVLSELEHVLSSARKLEPDSMQEHFVIGVDEYAHALFGPELVSTIHKVAPNVSLSFVVANPARYSEQLARNEVDLLVAPVWQDLSEMVTKELFYEEFIGLMSSRHPLANKKVTPKKFVEYPHVLVSSRGVVTGNVDIGLKKKTLSRRVALTLPWYESAPAYLSNDQFLLSVGSRLGKKLIKKYPVKQFDIPISVPGFSVSMVWHPRNTSEPRNSWLRKTVEAVYAGMKI